MFKSKVGGKTEGPLGPRPNRARTAGPARRSCESLLAELILTAPNLLAQFTIADQTIQLLRRLLQPSREH